MSAKLLFVANIFLKYAYYYDEHLLDSTLRVESSRSKLPKCHLLNNLSRSPKCNSSNN